MGFEQAAMVPAVLSVAARADPCWGFSGSQRLARLQERRWLHTVGSGRGFKTVVGDMRRPCKCLDALRINNGPYRSGPLPLQAQRMRAARQGARGATAPCKWVHLVSGCAFETAPMGLHPLSMVKLHVVVMQGGRGAPGGRGGPQWCMRKRGTVISFSKPDKATNQKGA